MKAFDTKEHGKGTTSSSERPSGQGDMKKGVGRLMDNMNEKREPIRRADKE